MIETMIGPTRTKEEVEADRIQRKAREKAHKEAGKTRVATERFLENERVLVLNSTLPKARKRRLPMLIEYGPSP